jgi:uncharacterized protein (TIGR03435 family)
MYLKRLRGVICLFCFVTALPGFGGTQTPPTATAAQQTGGAALTSFPIVSIVPLDKDRKDKSWGYHYRDDGFFGKGFSAYLLIQEAYLLYDNERILDVPSWARSAEFDIGAKVEPSEVRQFSNMTDDQRRAMLRAILASRFKLASHYEKRVFPVYDLVIAKKGIKMSLSNSTMTRGMNVLPGLITGSRPGYLQVEDFSLKGLSSLLHGASGRQVVDRTGLTGLYDFTLRWNPNLDVPTDQTHPDSTSTLQAEGPSIFTALQEQLGLRLAPAKAELDVLVIDHMEPPTPN